MSNSNQQQVNSMNVKTNYQYFQFPVTQYQSIGFRQPLNGIGNGFTNYLYSVNPVNRLTTFPSSQTPSPSSSSQNPSPLSQGPSPLSLGGSPSQVPSPFLSAVPSSITHSHSAPAGFMNSTYTYSLQPVFRYENGNENGNNNGTGQSTTANMSIENVKKLLNSNSSKNSFNVINSVQKADNSDLIDLAEAGFEDKDEDVLVMFDPLMEKEKEAQRELEKEARKHKKEKEKEKENKTNEKLNGEMIKTQDETDKTNVTKVDRSLNDPSVASSIKLVHEKILSKPLKVVRKKTRANEEQIDFSNKIRDLRSQFISNDFIGNVGIVISPTLESQRDHSLSVKLVIETNELNFHNQDNQNESLRNGQSISFTCNVDTSIEHIVSHVICTLVEDASQVSHNLSSDY